MALDFETRNARRIVFTRTAPDGSLVRFVLRAADVHRQFLVTGPELEAIRVALDTGEQPVLPSGTIIEEIQVVDLTGDQEPQS